MLVALPDARAYRTIESTERLASDGRSSRLALATGDGS